MNQTRVCREKTCIGGIATVIAFLLGLQPMTAQDVHFSNFSYLPAHYNPAYTGLFDGTYRVVFAYRSQWQSVPVPYESALVSFDMALGVGKSSRVGLGLSMVKDAAGDANMRTNIFSISSKLEHPFSKRWTVGVGFSGSFFTRSANPENATWESQYNGDQFDPSLNSGESFAGINLSFASIGGGIALSYGSQSTRDKLLFGLAAKHLNRPHVSFYTDPSIRIPTWLNLNIWSSKQMSRKWDLTGMGKLSKQDAYREVQVGAGLRYHFTLTTHLPGVALASLSYRIKDAWIPMVGVEIGNWTAGVSFDFNTSPWKVASGGRGGPELFLHYIVTKVPPPEDFKPCPIF